MSGYIVIVKMPLQEFAVVSRDVKEEAVVAALIRAAQAYESWSSSKLSYEEYNSLANELFGAWPKKGTLKFPRINGYFEKVIIDDLFVIDS